jgi:hypothetical protein
MGRQETWQIVAVDRAGHRSDPRPLTINVTDSPNLMLIGGTLRGTDGSNSPVGYRPPWDIVRVYNHGDAMAVAPGVKIAISYTSILNPGWRTNSSLVTTVTNQMAALPDVPGQRVDFQHEFDNPGKYGVDYATYLLDAAKFKQMVTSVNAGRNNPLVIFRCCMAYSFSQPARQIDQFYVRDPQNYDEFAPDVYKPVDIAMVVDKAAQYGKPLGIPEYGPLDNVDHNDAAILSYMQQGYATWKDKARWACWFDKLKSGADFDAVNNQATGEVHSAYTQSLAFWGSKRVRA